MIIKPCTKAEVDFYQTCAARNEPLLPYMPRFMGTLQLSTPEQKQALEQQKPPLDGNAASLSLADAGPLKGKKLETEQAIVLENAAAGFVKPNIMDLKLGARLWDDAAPPAKRQRLDDVAKKTTSGSLGFRVAGMRVWNAEKQEFKAYDKMYGRQFNEETVIQAFEEYFRLKARGRKDSSDLQGVLHVVKKEVEAVRAALEVMELRMYSASILIVYEGDKETLRKTLDAHTQAVGREAAKEDVDDYGEVSNVVCEVVLMMWIDSDDADEQSPFCKVVMIDFAHATFVSGQGRDENVLRGVDSVLDILETMS